MNILSVFLSPRIYMVMAILGIGYSTWTGQLTVTNIMNYLTLLTQETVSFIHSINWGYVITSIKNIAASLH